MTGVGGAAGPAWDVLDAAPDAMIVLDALGRITFVNAQVERVFGYSRSELTGNRLDALLPERFRSRHSQHIARYLSSPTVRPMGGGLELVGQRKNGEEFPVEVALSSIERGGATMAIAAVRDITARKQAQDELQRSREDLAITLESIGDGVIVADLQGRVVRLNPVAERLTGWSTGEAAGRGMDEVFRIINEESRNPAQSPVPTVLRDGTVVELASHTVLMARDGTECPIADSCAPLRSGRGEVRGVVLVFRDDSAEAAEQRSLRETVRIQRQLDCAPLTIVRMDRHARITHVNEAWRRFARENGTDAETIDGVGLDYLVAASRVCQESATAVAAALTEMVAGRMESFTCDYPCHSPTEVRWFRLDAKRIAADDAVVLIHTNITDHHLAEARGRVQSVVTQALADRLPLLDTCRRVIRTTCEGLEWDFAAIWTPGDGECLHCADVWTKPGCDAAGFENAARCAEFTRGRGLPGRVWATGAPEWIADIAADPTFTRAASALAPGLRSGFAVPILCDKDVIAVIELFSRIRRGPDSKLLELLATAGVQLGAEELRARTKRKADAVATELRTSEARHRVLYERSRDALMTLAPPTWQFSSGNSAAIEMFGARDEADFLARAPWNYSPDRQPDGRDSGEKAKEMIETAMREGSHFFAWTHRRISGETFPASVLLSRVDLDGESFLQATVRDETEARRAQAELASAQRLAAVGTLAAGVAHEINTPIQFVGDSIHFLRDAARDAFALIDKLLVVHRMVAEEAQASDLRDAVAAASEAAENADLEYLHEKVPEAFDRCLDGLERVTTIVRSMKEFSHPAQDEMAPVDLNRAIQSTLTIAGNEYKYVAGLETELGELPPVTCHVNDINQVVLNLIVNAAHAIGDVVKGSDKKGTLRVRTRRDGEHIVISVGDTGAGIPEAIAHRIFEPFFTTKEVGKGTGQGLALAWAVVKEKHGGELTFESLVGEGTTFFIRLPIAGRKAAHGAGH